MALRESAYAKRTGFAERPEAGLRAVNHATVGGWMTARWSGVLLERTVETPRSRRILKSSAVGVSHGERRVVSEDSVLAGARDAKRWL
jgi:hypothetical protein